MTLQARAEIVLICVLLPFSWLTVCLRLWVRGKITKSLWWDDAFMMITLVSFPPRSTGKHELTFTLQLFFTCYCAFILVIISRGGFDHLALSETIKETILVSLTAEAT